MRYEIHASNNNYQGNLFKNGRSFATEATALRAIQRQVDFGVSDKLFVVPVFTDTERLEWLIVNQKRVEKLKGTYDVFPCANMGRYATPREAIDDAMRKENETKASRYSPR